VCLLQSLLSHPRLQALPEMAGNQSRFVKESIPERKAIFPRGYPVLLPVPRSPRCLPTLWDTSKQRSPQSREGWWRRSGETPHTCDAKAERRPWSETRRPEPEGKLEVKPAFQTCSPAFRFLGGTSTRSSSAGVAVLAAGWRCRGTSGLRGQTAGR